jgi:hypothetical protein
MESEFHDYEKLFNNPDLGYNLVQRETSMENLDNLFNNKNLETYIQNLEALPNNNYDIRLEEMIVDKAETESNSKIYSPKLDLDIESKKK